MSLRLDAGAVLQAMGYVPGVDFNAAQTDASTVTVTWLAQSAMPSEATINAYDLNAGVLAALYTKAKALQTAADPVSKKENAVLLVVLDTFNRQSKQFRDLLAAIAAATSLANLQTRAAAIAPVEPARTISDLRTAVENKIDAGQAD